MNRPLLLLSVSAICLAQPATADPVSITHGTDWKDTAGNPIAAHEGELSRFHGAFYWSGSSYANNPKGKFDIPVRNALARKVMDGNEIMRIGKHFTTLVALLAFQTLGAVPTSAGEAPRPKDPATTPLPETTYERKTT